MKCVLTILLTAVSGFAANIDFSTGQAARLVIGQPHFDAASDSASQTIIGGAAGLAYANNTLFVADSNIVGAVPVNNRVLILNNLSSQLPGLTDELVYNKVCPACVGQANLVLGQPDFTTITPTPCIASSSSGSTTSTTGTQTCPTNASTTPTAAGLRSPSAVASDGTHLVVADTLNNRVLIWNTIPVTNAQAPDVVVGQSDFTTATVPGSTPTASSLRGPQGVWLQNGKLYIADTQNNRVLIYNSIPTGNGASADVVLGQPNFTTFVQVDITQQKTNAAANNMLSPVSVTSDGIHLFVTDLGYNRVLIWNTIPTSNQTAADVVIGQPNVTSSLPNNAFTADTKGVETPVLCTTSNGKDANSNPTYPSLCASTLSFPRFALSDGTRLFLADGGNDRILVFNTIPTSNGASADYVLGQPDANTDRPTRGADSLTTPHALAWDGHNLFVADVYNQRIMVFSPAEQHLPVTAVRNAASLNIYAIGAVKLGGTIKSADKVTITIQGKAYTYTIQSGDTATGIINGLVALVNTGSGDPNVLATANAAVGEVVLTARASGAAGNGVTLAASTSTGAQITVTVSGANLSGGGDAAKVAPGTLVSILGTNLSDGTASAAGAESLPTKLGGVEVYLNGVVAPLLFVSPTQINTQIPFSFLDTASINVWVRIEHSDGTVSATNPQAVSLVPANPGIFTMSNSQTDPRPAVVLHGSSYATGVISVDGTINAGDVGTVCIGSTASGCSGGRTYNYTVQASDTLNTVVNALVALISKDSQVTAYAASSFTRIVLQAKTAGTAGNGIGFSASVNTGAKLLLTAIGQAPSSGSGVALCCASTGGSLVTANSPAVAGENVIVYATGLGLPVLTDAVKPYVITGKVYQGSANNTPMDFVSSLTNGKTANVIGAALAPGMIGVYQVTLQLSTALTSDPQTQLTIAQDLFVSNIVTFPVVASVIPTTLTCNPTSLASKGTSTCTITLNAVAPSGGATVALASNNSALTVPASASVAAGATTGTFTATAGTVSSSQTAVITASYNGSSATASISLTQ